MRKVRELSIPRSQVLPRRCVDVARSTHERRRGIIVRSLPHPLWQPGPGPDRGEGRTHGRDSSDHSILSRTPAADESQRARKEWKECGARGADPRAAAASVSGRPADRSVSACGACLWKKQRAAADNEKALSPPTEGFQQACHFGFKRGVPLKPSRRHGGGFLEPDPGGSLLVHVCICCWTAG